MLKVLVESRLDYLIHRWDPKLVLKQLLNANLRVLNLDKGVTSKVCVLSRVQDLTDGHVGHRTRLHLDQVDDLRPHFLLSVAFDHMRVVELLVKLKLVLELVVRFLDKLLLIGAHQVLDELTERPIHYLGLAIGTLEYIHLLLCDESRLLHRRC